MPFRGEQVKDFEIWHEVPDSGPVEVLREVVATWTAPLASYGYALTSQTDVAVTYHRQYRPAAVIVLAILFFPIGLLALLYTASATVTATAESDGEGTRLLINGKAPKRVREDLGNLRI